MGIAIGILFLAVLCAEIVLLQIWAVAISISGITRLPMTSSTNHSFLSIFLSSTQDSSLFSATPHYCLIVLISTLSTFHCLVVYSMTIHCVSKKVPSFKLSVTLSNLNRFSKFLHCWKAREICYKSYTTI